MVTAHLERLARVRTHADKSAGFIKLQELSSLGVPKSTVSRWVAEGLLHRFHPGVYRTIGGTYGFDDAVYLATKLMRPQQAVAGRSAAAFWDLPGGSKGRIEVIGPESVKLKTPHLIVRRARDLRPVDVTTHSGVSVTTPLRTLFDAAPLLSSSEVGALMTGGVQRRAFTYQDVLSRGREVSRHGKSGVRTVLGQLRHRIELTDRQLNSYESSALALFRRAGFPEPVPQFELRVGGRVYYLDFGWPDFCIGVECDSMLAHSTPEQLRSDLERQNDVTAAGITLLRFTYQHVTESPDYVIETLARHLPRSAASRAR